MSADRKASRDGDRAERVVQAAGGVVWRRRDDGVDEVDVLLVHRPKYDDWTLPKGKLEADESHERAAIREVHEETGLLCVLGSELDVSEYTDGKGRPKVVRYWMMQATAGSFAPNDEVDEVRWLPVSQAVERLTYGRDLPVLDSFSRRLRHTGPG
jgi:8-oxo-dGTP pyrophosphatase MutT (NUDIX family)